MSKTNIQKAKRASTIQIQITAEIYRNTFWRERISITESEIEMKFSTSKLKIQRNSEKISKKTFESAQYVADIKASLNQQIQINRHQQKKVIAEGNTT